MSRLLGQRSSLSLNGAKQESLNSPGPSSRPWYKLISILALIGLGIGANLLALTLDQNSIQRLGGNPPINSGASDLADIRAHNSPTVVQNPVNKNSLVAVNRIDQPLFGCGLHISVDGGARWASGELPFPAGEENPPRCFAPDAAFTVDGTLYVSFVTLKGMGNTPNAGWIVSSKDGGRTFSTPTRVLGPLSFQVRLAADPARVNTLYLTYLKVGEVGNLQIASEDNPIEFLRSDDGGTTWQGPARVNGKEPGRVVAPWVSTGPDGQLYLLYLDLGEDTLDYNGAHQGLGGDPYDGEWSLVLARSLDRGARWNRVQIGEVVPTQRFIVFFPPAPSLAVADDGRIYATFHDGRLGDPDVLLWTSGDGGKTFSAPARVNDTPRRDGSSQYLPRVGVAPEGRVDVLYLDRREDFRDVMTEASLQSSFDLGQTFLSRIPLSTSPFDSRLGFGSSRKMPEAGSRLGLVMTNQRALAAWPDTRLGTAGSNKQDLASAVVAFTAESPMRRPLHWGGVALAFAGAAMILAWVINRRRPGTGSQQLP